MLDAGGEYAWRVRGEEHMWTPDAIAKLQHSDARRHSSRPTRNTRS
jgi:glutamate synthase domain-containing protein 2